MIKKCTIITPQFKGDEIHSWVIQSGLFDTETLKFTTGVYAGHDVQFGTVEDFDKYKVEHKPDMLFAKKEFDRKL